MNDIPNIYSHKLSNLILKQKKFSRIIELDISGMHLVDDISCLTSLKKLYMNHKVGQESINKLNLIELHINDNEKIKDVSFMTNLKKLYAQCYSGIDQQGISGLNLIELCATNNDAIKNVSFMTNLKKIKCIRFLWN